MYGIRPGVGSGAVVAGVAVTQLPQTGANLLLVGSLAVALIFLGFVCLRLAARRSVA